MKITFNSSRFGPIEVDEEKIINFPEGIPGFSGLKRYILMDYRDTLLKWLQSVDDPDIAFIVAPPEAFTTGFQVEADGAASNVLGLTKNEDLAVLLILRVEDGKVIPNVKAPLLLNASLMRGMQLVPERL